MTTHVAPSAPEAGGPSRPLTGHRWPRRPVLWVAGLVVLVAALLALLAAGLDVPDLLIDPATAAGLADTRPWIGALSQVGVMSWTVGFAVVALAAHLTPDRSARPFLLHAALLLAILAVDDVFLLHESVAPRVLQARRAEHAMILGEGLIALALVVRHRRRVAASLPLLVVAAACFAASLVVDLVVVDPSDAFWVLEDGTKLAGILTVTRVAVGWAIDALRPATAPAG